MMLTRIWKRLFGPGVPPPPCPAPAGVITGSAGASEGSRVSGRGSPRPLCTVEDCDRPRLSLGLCGKHYARYRRHGDPAIRVRRTPALGAVCEIEGCDRPRRALGLCSTHHSQYRRRGTATPIRLKADPWTAREDEALLAVERYETGRARQGEFVHVAILLGRSEQACRTRCYVLRKQQRAGS